VEIYEEADRQTGQIDAREAKEIRGQEKKVVWERPASLPEQRNRPEERVQGGAGDARVVHDALPEEGVGRQGEGRGTARRQERDDGLGNEGAPGTPLVLVAEQHEERNQSDPQQILVAAVRKAGDGSLLPAAAPPMNSALSERTLASTAAVEAWPTPRGVRGERRAIRGWGQ
jgi:hypothetical protein